MSERKCVPSWSILLSFLVPVTDGVMFLTGDDTTINDHYLGFSVASTISFVYHVN